MRKMQDELVKIATRGRDASLVSSNERPQLFFYLWSEGPYQERWVHDTIIEGDKRHFKLVLLDTCNGTVLKQAESFLVEIEHIMI